MDNPVINGLFVFILGMVVIFSGMSIIVLFVSLAGKLFNAHKKEVKVVETVENDVVPASEDEIPVHVKAAIVAAISAYYFTESKSKCDFVVKRIKRF